MFLQRLPARGTIPSKKKINVNVLLKKVIPRSGRLQLGVQKSKM